MSTHGRLRLFYFLYYGGIGVSIPYLAPYLRGLGFSGAEIGTVQGIGLLVSGPAALIWATWADRRGSHGRALRLASVVAAAAMFALPLARTPAQVGLVLLVQGVSAPALVPLVDSITVDWLQREGRSSYARTRLFGSVGFVLLAQGAGLVLSLRGDRSADCAVPWLLALCALGYAAAAHAVRADLSSADGAAHPPRGEAVRRLFRDRGFLALLLMGTFHWVACAPFHLFFGVLVRDRGLSSGITGASMALAVSAEVGVLLAFPWLEKRVSLRALFSVAFAGTGLRWVLVWRVESAAVLVGVQALHGLTFGLFWASLIKALAAKVPTPLRSTGQAIVSATVFGIGNALGFRLAGLGYDHFGRAEPLFGIASVIEIVPLVLALAVATDAKRPPPSSGT